MLHHILLFGDPMDDSLPGSSVYGKNTGVGYCLFSEALSDLGKRKSNDLTLVLLPRTGQVWGID